MSDILDPGQGAVFVDVGENKSSFSRIYTTGLDGCYGLLVDGNYNELPFCFLHHRNEPIDPHTSLKTEEILADLIGNLVQNLKKSLQKILNSEEQIILHTSASNLSLFVVGGLQQPPDFIRMAFFMLQDLSDLAVNNMFEPNSDEFFICQQLKHRTTMVDAVGYMLSDEVEHDGDEGEDDAGEGEGEDDGDEHDAGEGEDDSDEDSDEDNQLDPATAWIIYDCRSKHGNLGVRFRCWAGKVDLARMRIDLASIKKEKYSWQLQPAASENFAKSIENDPMCLSLLDEGIARVLATITDDKSDLLSNDNRLTTNDNRLTTSDSRLTTSDNRLTTSDNRLTNIDQD